MAETKELVYVILCETPAELASPFFYEPPAPLTISNAAGSPFLISNLSTSASYAVM